MTNTRKLVDEEQVYQVKNSLLDKKSYLQFEYPNTVERDGPPTIVRLPFYEDPEIRESKRARYASYKVLNRASELFSYLGSDARQLSLTFKISLPHISNMYNTSPAGAVPTGISDIQGEKSMFFELTPGSGRGAEQIRPRAGDYRAAYTPEGVPTAAELNELGYPLTPEGYTEWRDTVSSNQKRRGDAVKDILVYWLDMIRSATYNNVEDPLFGPPIVRLTHGIMYRGIPCISTNYSFTYDPNTGYDKDTLIPRVIKVDMDLKEIRAGDFGTFDPSPLKAGTQDGDNLAGWEAVIRTGVGSAIGGTLDSVQGIGL
jgi:hypothetical protein